MDAQKKNQIRAIVWGLTYAQEAETFDVERAAVSAARAGVRANILNALKLNGKTAAERYEILTDPNTVNTLRAELDKLNGKASKADSVVKS